MSIILPMNNDPLFMQIANAVSDLEDDVTREVLAKVCELDDLVEELAALQDWSTSSTTIIRRGKTPTLED